MVFYGWFKINIKELENKQLGWKQKCFYMTWLQNSRNYNNKSLIKNNSQKAIKVQKMAWLLKIGFKQDFAV